MITNGPFFEALRAEIKEKQVVTRLYENFSCDCHDRLAFVDIWSILLSTEVMIV